MKTAIAPRSAAPDVPRCDFATDASQKCGISDDDPCRVVPRAVPDADVALQEVWLADGTSRVAATTTKAEKAAYKLWGALIRLERMHFEADIGKVHMAELDVAQVRAEFKVMAVAFIDAELERSIGEASAATVRSREVDMAAVAEVMVATEVQEDEEGVELELVELEPKKEDEDPDCHDTRVPNGFRTLAALFSSMIAEVEVIDAVPGTLAQPRRSVSAGFEGNGAVEVTQDEAEEAMSECEDDAGRGWQGKDR